MKYLVNNVNIVAVIEYMTPQKSADNTLLGQHTMPGNFLFYFDSTSIDGNLSRNDCKIISDNCLCEKKT